MKKILTITILVFISYTSFAQQDAQFTHYMFNTLAVNPGYAGSRDALTVTGLHRSQWVGFDGAPVTQTVTLHTPAFSENIGLGLSVINDEAGPVKNTSFYADFAYKLKLGAGKLALGLKGGLSRRSENLSTIALGDQVDNSFMKDVGSELLPNVGFGVYYSAERFYVGASAPRLLENDFSSNTTSGGTSLSKETNHYFFIAGAVFNLTSNGEVKIKPTAFVKMTNGAPLEGDITATFLFHDKIWLGPMFRTGDAYGALIGYNFTDQLSAGYSFDWSYTNNTSKYNNGSHEVMLRYDFRYNNKAKIRSPRYF